MKWLSKLLGLDETSEYRQSFVTRGGEIRQSDAVFEAWTSGDLQQMMSALNVPTHPVDRHHLLQSIVELAYKERNKNPEMRELCERTANLHLSEFPALVRPLRAEFMDPNEPDFLPRVTTFQYLATLLTEDGKFDEAVGVCESAIGYDLHDGTAGGFEGRIDRIKKKQNG